MKLFLLTNILLCCTNYITGIYIIVVGQYNMLTIVYINYMQWTSCEHIYYYVTHLLAINDSSWHALSIYINNNLHSNFPKQ